MTAARTDGRCVGRREFLRCASCTTLGLVSLAALGASAGCVSLVTHPVPVTAGSARLRLADFPSLGEPGGSAVIRPEGLEQSLVVFSLARGEYVALPMKCTHRGCTVNVRGTELVCPCHGSTFDNRGNILRGPAERPLAPFAVSMLEDQVLAIQLSGAS